jgi:hypothetical protein
MATHQNRNWHFQDPTAEVSNGDAFIGCNLEQLTPNTVILAGKTGLTFNSCRLINCSLPGDAVIESCNTAQISFCANLHPDRVAAGQSAEPENCTHVTETDEVWVDGVLVETIYHYTDAPT